MGTEFPASRKTLSMAKASPPRATRAGRGSGLALKERLADLAANGLTQAEAARILQVSPQRVSQVKAELGLSFRRRLPPVSQERLEELVERRFTRAEAARELGGSPDRVSQLAAKLGLSFAPALRSPRAPGTALGRILQEARLRARLSYRELAALSGLHKREIANIEVGQTRHPRESTLRALAGGLQGHTSYDELVEAAGRRYPEVPPERLKELVERRLTQKEVAKELGVSRWRVRELAAKIGLSFAQARRTPKAPTTEFGRVLQTARLASGYSFTRLSVLSGLHRRHVIELERGRVRRPQDRTIRALADCLDGHASYADLVNTSKK